MHIVNTPTSAHIPRWDLRVPLQGNHAGIPSRNACPLMGYLHPPFYMCTMHTIVLRIFRKLVCHRDTQKWSECLHLVTSCTHAEWCLPDTLNRVSRGEYLHTHICMYGEIHRYALSAHHTMHASKGTTQRCGCRNTA